VKYDVPFDRGAQCPVDGLAFQVLEISGRDHNRGKGGLDDQNRNEGCEFVHDDSGDCKAGCS
jgi:hypothetical protein